MERTSFADIEEVPTSDWLLHPPQSENRTQFFMFPYAGSGASLYRAWPTAINEICLNPVQPPGRENRLRECESSSFRKWAVDFTDVVQANPDLYHGVLFGHCMGAVTAAAVAAEMNSRGLAPKALVVSSSRPPDLPPEKRYLPPPKGAVGVYHMSMTEEELGEELQKVMQRRGTEIPPELLPISLGVLLRDLNMCFNYRPNAVASVGCPVHAVAWEDDLDVAHEEMDAWENYGTSFKKHVLPGDKMSFADRRDDLFDLFEEIATGEYRK